jgi:hypothetical protein
VSNALFSLEQQQAQYLTHFSQSMALSSFWKQLLPPLPTLFPASEQRGDQTARLASTVAQWEADCGQVLKYLSVYCVHRLRQFSSNQCNSDDDGDDETYADNSKLPESEDETAKRFVQVLLREVRNFSSGNMTVTWLLYCVFESDQKVGLEGRLLANVEISYFVGVQQRFGIRKCPFTNHSTEQLPLSNQVNISIRADQCTERSARKRDEFHEN